MSSFSKWMPQRETVGFAAVGRSVRVKRDLTSAPGSPVALTIGNFDGVHRGHQAMLTRLIEAAEDLRLPPAVLTFDPHPREFFSPATAPARLSSLRSKLDLFRAFGVATTFVARFDARLSSLTAAEFISDVLERRLEVHWLLVGADFRFGRGRVGDLAFIRAATRRFSVEAMGTVAVDGERASSTAIRDALSAGDLARAAALLGRNYAITGHVAHGDKLGRSLGFPTANIALRRVPALTGIFAVRVHGLSGVPRAGVASVGVRPTIKADGRPIAEVYLFDFNETIYGKRLTIEFLHKLRDEERYPDLDALTRQIGRDVLHARKYFATRD
ncbi:MAG: bifunctional riboflavin kinase/FAD synthetase [Pseudomonadota bacterium]|nr:bifunctional riboflavin kinase/FAD synthetase [Pseudomonadota bacterium]